MSIVVTGSAGRLGRIVMTHLRTAGVDVVPLDLPFDLLRWQGPAQTIVHLAVAWDDPARTFEMTRHLLATPGLQRFVYASSITIDPASGFGPINHLGAAKLAGEAWMAAWAHASGGRAIALRLGRCGFDEAQAPTPLEEAVQLTDRGLRWWLDRALGDVPEAGRLTIWNAVGNGGI